MKQMVKVPYYSEESNGWMVEAWIDGDGEGNGKNIFFCRTEEIANAKFKYFVDRGHEIVEYVPEVAIVDQHHEEITAIESRQSPVDHIQITRNIIAENWNATLMTSADLTTRKHLMYRRCHTLISMYPELFASVIADRR